MGTSRSNEEKPASLGSRRARHLLSGCLLHAFMILLREGGREGERNWNLDPESILMLPSC